MPGGAKTKNALPQCWIIFFLTCHSKQRYWGFSTNGVNRVRWYYLGKGFIRVNTHITLLPQRLNAVSNGLGFGFCESFEKHIKLRFYWEEHLFITSSDVVYASKLLLVKHRLISRSESVRASWRVIIVKGVWTMWQNDLPPDNRNVIVVASEDTKTHTGSCDTSVRLRGFHEAFVDINASRSEIRLAAQPLQQGMRRGK